MSGDRHDGCYELRAVVRLCEEGAECWGHFRGTGVSYTLQLADLIVDVLSKSDILRPPREDSARTGGQDGGWGQSCQEAFPEFPGTGPRISAPIKTGSQLGGGPHSYERALKYGRIVSEMS